MKKRELVIGILGFQGAFEKHREVVENLGYKVRIVRYLSELDAVDALIIPGGESTTMTKIAGEMGYLSFLKGFDRPVFGTCAGAILLGRVLDDDRVESFGRVPVTLKRNAYGRQIDSFVDEVELSFDKKPFKGIFIRAPKIVEIGNGVEVLGRHNSDPVFVRYGKYMMTTFHPELTQDYRVHKYFIEEICFNQ
ncbi:MAG: pyridoxal 5'-phosphate synthase glutaminase subunit PdxT [Candidatus Neomarinimicrobiota bacterium]|nr:MAG: pyridoxal 5'-phosphate synthase glutaminase subunit PdxT [Candidatus Neomarinimicrobiota bacterium]